MHVFINYSHQDQEVVRRVVNDLRTQGIEVWYDNSGLMGNLQQAIMSAITDAAVMLYMVSPDSISSPWVKAELAYARSARKPVIVVIMRPALLSPTLSIYKQVDLSTSYQENFHHLIEMLPPSVRQGIPSRQEQPVPADAPRSRGYVFVSYAEEDSSFVGHLREFLGERGFGYWDYQESDRDYHSQLFIELEDVIKSAVATLSILSPDWKRSKWATKEYIFSEEVHTPVFLLKVRETGPMIVTAGIPYIDFTLDQEKGFSRLDHELQRKGLV